MPIGKIISVVGGPRAGKSFLVRRLAKHYNGIAILEGEEQDFPKRILENIQKNIRPLERTAWFRNKLVKNYLQALKEKRAGKIVVTDNFWISYQLYIDVLNKDFEESVIQDMAEIDRLALEWPDITLLLSPSEKTIRDFIKRGGRKFDQGEDYISKQILPVHKIHERFFSQDGIKEKVINIQRDNLDFDNEEHFKNLIEKIENFNNSHT